MRRLDIAKWGLKYMQEKFKDKCHSNIKSDIKSNLQLRMMDW